VALTVNLPPASWEKTEARYPARPGWVTTTPKPLLPRVPLPGKPLPLKFSLVTRTSDRSTTMYFACMYR